MGFPLSGGKEKDYSAPKVKKPENQGVECKMTQLAFRPKVCGAELVSAFLTEDESRG